MYDLENPNVITEISDIPIEYDKYGRMKRHSAFHSNVGKPFTQEDVQYLINYYSIAGAEEMSFALERPIISIQELACKLRKKGLLSNNKVSHKRIQKR